jgi:hypothetical protein
MKYIVECPRRDHKIIIGVGNEDVYRTVIGK